MTSITAPETIVLYGLRSHSMDTVVIRGSAPLQDLSRISAADEYDQVTRPTGLQRALSAKHASDFYDYAARPGRWDREVPEVLLNVRPAALGAIDIEEVHVLPGGDTLVKVTIHLDRFPDGDEVAISRKDGNHRLFHGNGDGRRRQPLDVPIPYSLTMGQDRGQETFAFRTINSQQKGLDTTHLNTLAHNLATPGQEQEERPERWIAYRLTEDPSSPWTGLVHKGGKRPSKKERDEAATRGVNLLRPVNAATLIEATRRMLSGSRHLQTIGRRHGVEAQYKVVREFWIAVHGVWAEEWAAPVEYNLLKNVGVLVLATYGADVMDDLIPKNKLHNSEFAKVLEEVRPAIDWHKDAAGARGTRGLSGNAAVKDLTERLRAEAIRPVDDDAMDEMLASLAR